MISVGNFEMLPLAQALDVVRIGLAPVLTSANERLVKLLQAPHTGLTDGLQAPGDDDENGLSELAWTGAGAGARGPAARPRRCRPRSRAPPRPRASRIASRWRRSRRGGRPRWCASASTCSRSAWSLPARRSSCAAPGPLGVGAPARVLARVRELVPHLGRGRERDARPGARARAGGVGRAASARRVS